MSTQAVWYANLPSATGTQPRDHYSRFRHVSTPAQEEFVRAVLKQNFAWIGEHEGSVLALFDYQQPRFQKYFEKTPLQGKFLAVAGGKKHVIHVKMGADEQTMALGAKTFATVDSPSKGLLMVGATPNDEGKYTSAFGDYVAYLTPYKQGRHLYATEADMYRLGRGLAVLEKKLGALTPDLKQEIAAASQGQIERLLEGAQWVARHHKTVKESWPEYADELANVTESFIHDTRATWVSSHFNMIHGDVMLNRTGSLIVMDCERIADGWNRPGLDLGQAAARIPFEAPTSRAGKKPCSETALRAAMSLLDGYNETTARPVTPQYLIDKAFESLAISKIFSVASQLANKHDTVFDPKSSLDRFMGMLDRVNVLRRGLRIG